MIYKGINFNGTHYNMGTGYDVWCNWNDDEFAPLFIGERFLLLVHSASIDNPRLVYLGMNNAEVTYKRDADDYVIVDVTDYVRTYSGASIIIILDYGVTLEILEYGTTRLLRDPRNMIIPQRNNVNPYYDGCYPVGTNNMKNYLIYNQDSDIITVPNMLYVNSRFGGVDLTNARGFYYKNLLPIKFEYFGGEGNYPNVETYEGAVLWEEFTTPHEEFPYNFGSIDIYCPYYYDNVGVEEEIIYDRFYFGNSDVIVRPMQNNRRYVMVRWISSIGQLRQHIFEVRKIKQSTTNNYNLLSLTGLDNQIKGETCEFALYLDRLTRYDLWYYSDIIKSSKVELYMCGNSVWTDYEKTTLYGMREINPRWIRIQISDSSMSIPDGDAFNGELEINVKYAEYDAVAL